jgi:4-amino-4-deoxy-L-arabinose transferase-like glycosyltransferase
MNAPQRLSFAGFVLLLLDVGAAAGVRIAYLTTATDNGRGTTTLSVQGGGLDAESPLAPGAGDERQTGVLGQLVRNLSDHQWYGAKAPLADAEERTGHVAPGYPWLIAQLVQFDPAPEALIRWLQCALGALTAGCLFLFARRAFNSETVAVLAGLLAAIHPFWIISSAELNDGVLSTFLLAAALLLGTRGAQSGGAFTSLLFGLSLAGLAMVRAALLPFGLVGLLWYLYHCKNIRYGWFNAILAFLGFANGVGPWVVRNWNAFEEPVPIVTSTYLHLWIGNHPQAHGGSLDEADLRKSFSPERLKGLLDEPNQAKRYASLGRDVLEEIKRDPAATVTHRWQAAVKFLLGGNWLKDQRMSRENPEAMSAPDWLAPHVEFWLQGMLLAIVVLGVLGWRWSQAWKNNARLATFALVWLPLPYLLSHAGDLCGPRLPWDALLICYSAYALACLAPSVAGSSEPE